MLWRRINADEVAKEFDNIKHTFQEHTKSKWGCDVLKNQAQWFGYGALHLGKKNISGKKGYIRVSCAMNLWAGNKAKRLKMIAPMELEADTYQKLTIEVYAPNLVELIKAMHGSVRVQYYDAGTGYMGTHVDSCNNDGDVSVQKISWAFELPSARAPPRM